LSCTSPFAHLDPGCSVQRAGVNNVFQTRYLICLTIGPIFFAAGIYLCFSRLIVLYGANLSCFRPRTYVTVFIISDVFSLILQAVGGGIAAQSRTSHSKLQSGVDIMVAGLALQVASLACFGGCCVDYYLRVRAHLGELNPSYTTLRTSRKSRLFLWCRLQRSVKYWTDINSY
jgi:hypothetical protein